jgi:hypothetical protein
MPGARFADSVSLLDLIRERPALVPGNTSATVAFQRTQPLRLKYFAAQLGYALAEVLPGAQGPQDYRAGRHQLLAIVGCWR